jgi:hypothetical protein
MSQQSYQSCIIDSALYKGRFTDRNRGGIFPNYIFHSYEPGLLPLHLIFFLIKNTLAASRIRTTDKLVYSTAERTKFITA